MAIRFLLFFGVAAFTKVYKLPSESLQKCLGQLSRPVFSWVSGKKTYKTLSDEPFIKIKQTPVLRFVQLFRSLASQAAAGHRSR